MKNIKIKAFTLRNSASEERVNQWIEENDIDVVDIKYQSMVDHPHIIDRVLVIYKESEEK